MDTLGDEAADLMAEVGKPLLPHQREWCRDSLGRRADGKWSAYESAIMEARQNGKGVMIEARELYALFILRTRQIIHSAHLFDTSRKAFERLMEIIDGSDWLTKRVARVNRAHGKEGVELTRQAGGGMLSYKARTLHGARGFSGELIILDESYALTTGHMAAISPILATLPNPAIVYASSPPDETTGPMPDDAFLPSVRARGLAGDPRMAYWEYSPPEGFDPADVDVWYLCNPSLGYLIQEEYLSDQLRLFTAARKPSKFSTEHLGAWPDAAARQWQVIAEADWADALDDQSAPLDPVVFAAWTSLDRARSAICVVGVRPDGNLHGEVVDHRPGSAWVVDRTVELVRRWRPARLVVDPGGAAGSYVADLTRALVPDYLEEITLLTARQVAQGYGALHDAIAGEDPPRRLYIREREPRALTAGMAGATTRRVGDGTTWDARDETVDISPVRALTDALQGHLMMPPPEPVYPPATVPAAQESPADFWRPRQRLSLS